ncbi:FIG4 [[Candida] subhashii]|uniref:FIG4 n=1 Tax=[Candida] subhashii TaxID=561895 RepID=A0A8J5QJZ0_9ASCO|nr:FIG4 [[Candida] subhashii]KAG7662137.1 FIG4 [[Candida] subhashii]
MKPSESIKDQDGDKVKMMLKIIKNQHDVKSLNDSIMPSENKTHIQIPHTPINTNFDKDRPVPIYSASQPSNFQTRGNDHIPVPETANEEDNESRNQDDSFDTPEFKNRRIILQRFTIYNSQTTMYIVGSNSKESLFRIMEIGKDPDKHEELMIIEDKNYFYTRKDMIELLNGLDESIEGGIHKIAHGYGLLGLVKFTRGYELIVITKCSQVAILGGHFIYHIDETKMIPLDINQKKPEKYSDEEKLSTIFKNFDLSKTFYFSYSYDITNTLQTNFMKNKRMATEFQFGSSHSHENDLYNNFDHNERFVWNNLLLKPILENQEVATYEWFQPMIHGFIDQANISIFGRKFYITIIARRSHHFAGARFLKRGVNDRGNVANEIETEQIVSDMLTTSFHDSRYGFYNNPRYTSFVQHRGSIPLYWTQDSRLPKPPIEINLTDPFYKSSAKHFNNLFQRYGSPLIILNLIKQKEKLPRESKLSMHFTTCIKYLNQFLPARNRIQYHGFDMSRHSKKNLDVIGPLQKIASSAVSQIQFFHNGIDLESTQVQTGIIRTNCIDCLDRTNAAQFIIGKEALAHQLRSLNFISQDQNLDYDSDLINILTEMFHDHGDTIAVQYGGSNLVNTMDSYRRINQWSSHTRDMINSIKRMYSNSFVDRDRQEAINLFLGNYVYAPDNPRLWEYKTDFLLHNTMIIDNLRIMESYARWFNEKYLSGSRFKLIGPPTENRNPFWDPEWKLEPYPDSTEKWFNECYVPRKFQSLDDIFQFNMNSNARYFPSNVANDQVFDYSPFDSRKQNRYDDSKTGEFDLKYLEGYPIDKEDDIYLKDANDKISPRRKDKKYSKTIRKFISKKIEKLAYQEKGSNSTEADQDISTLEDSLYDNEKRDDEYYGHKSTADSSIMTPEVDRKDSQLYKSQWDYSTILTEGKSVNSPEYLCNSQRVKVTIDDNDLYRHYTNGIFDTEDSKHGGGNALTETHLYNVQDLRLYGDYTGVDETKCLGLNTVNNYFSLGG